MFNLLLIIGLSLGLISYFSDFYRLFFKKESLEYYKQKLYTTTMILLVMVLIIVNVTELIK